MTPVKRKVALLFGAAIAIFYLVCGIVKPEMNWDVIGYVATLHYNEGLRDQKLLERTFAEVKAHTSTETFRALTEENDYRKTIYSNDVALTQQIPFYQGRVVYLQAIRTVSQNFSISFAQATYVVSATFTALTIFILFFLLTPNLLWILLLFPYVLKIAGFMELSTFSTPDGTTALFAVLGLLLAMKRSLWAVLPLTILPAIRTDFIILPAFIAAYLLWTERKLKHSLFFVLPLVVYFLVNKLFPNYGYLKVFDFTLIANNPLPAEMDVHKEIAPYLEAYKNGFSTMIGHKHFIIFALFIFGWLKLQRNRKSLEANGLVAIITGFVLAHMTLFPAYYQRFFAWCAAIAGLQLLIWLQQSKQLKTDVRANEES